MSDYKPTIGLEIHAELKTESKMFCGCKNDPDEKRPNTNVCPVCLGHPGTLPTINRRAVEAVVKLGLALGGKIPKRSKFDRKNYFYPDLPKGYQISQYDEPLVTGGALNGVRLTRIHLEEDTARLLHSAKGDSSLVDFNRSSIPLMELVTEPDIKSADETLAFARELQLILRYLGISDADMEKAQMRIEANVSVSKTEKLGTKVELKNINSFSAVKNAVAYEIKRQTEVLESGGKVAQETRGWNDLKGETFSQRSKEEAHDYRYMPEPDLPPLEITADVIERLRIEIPELPWAKRERFKKEYSLTVDQASILVSDRGVAEFFEEAVSEAEKSTPQLIYNYLTSDLLGMANAEGIGVKESKVEPVDFAHLIDLIQNGTLNSRSAKNVLAKMWITGVDPHQIVKDEGLTQVTDESSLTEVVAKIIEANSKAAKDYKKGNTNSLQFLIGRAMSELRGRGNPELLRKLFLDRLSK